MIPGLRRLFRLVGRPPSVEQDIDAELDFHFKAQIEAFKAGGLSDAEALAEARRRFGDTGETRARLRRIDRAGRRAARRAGRLEELAQDLKYTARGIRRQPGFAFLVVLTMGLGIGANATMFGIVDRLLLRPPAFLRDPARTGRVWIYRPLPDGGQRIDNNISWFFYRTMAEGTRSLEAAAAFFNDEERVVGEGEAARRRPVSLVTASFWHLFEVAPVLGRFFGPAEDQAPSGTPVAVLGYDFWRAAYGGEREVLGRTLRIGPRAYEIIGVAPQGFTGTSLSRVDLFVPLTAAAWDSFGADYAAGPFMSWLEMLARRRADAPPATVNGELTGAFQTGRRQEPNILEDRVTRSRAELTSVLYNRGPERSQGASIAIWLTGVSGFVLLLVCANVGNLLLARSLRRRREIAVRAALGAGRGRLVQQLLSESWALALLGGVAGLVLAHFGGGILRKTLVANVDWSATPLFDVRVLGFTAGAALVAGLLAGLAPAIHGWRADLHSALKAGGREGGRARSRLRVPLLAIQGAISVVLLVGAGLFVQSLRKAVAVDLGYEPDRLLVVQVDYRGDERPATERAAIQQRLLEQARGTPGVTSAAFTRGIPFRQSITVDLFSPARDTLPGTFYYNAVSNDYLETTGTRLVRGRPLTPTLLPGPPQEVLVSEALAARVWPGREAIGQCLRVITDTIPCAPVVGVTEDVRWRSLGDDDRMQVYVPLNRPEIANIYVRAAGDPERLVEPLRRELQGLVPGAAFVAVWPAASTLDWVLGGWRLGATMLSVFAVLALVVAAIGLYGVIAFSVTQRSHEMGVRLALGARARDVVRMILGEGVRAALIGIACGTAAALVAGRFIAALLFGVSPYDPGILIAAAAVLLAAAVLASLVPAWRATRVDPNQALRVE